MINKESGSQCDHNGIPYDTEIATLDELDAIFQGNADAKKGNLTSWDALKKDLGLDENDEKK